MNYAYVGEMIIKYKPSPRDLKGITLGTPEKAHSFVKDHIYENEIPLKELFYAIYADRQNRILSWNHISTGNLYGTLVDVKEIIKGALITPKCAGIMVCHNHPSGNPKPSSHDIKVTNKLKEACTLLDYFFLDHIIYTGYDDKFYSFSSPE